jgi:NAD+ synthase (glutamine-hydrolysing)
MALAQIDHRVGDLAGNARRIEEVLAEAEGQDVDLVAFPELAITGYPPEDLLLKDRFVAENLEALARVARATGEVAAVVGFVDRVGDELRNAAALCHRGQVVGVHHKRRLPNFSVFDEQRYFTPGSGPPLLFEVAGVAVGLSVCEDLWSAGGPVADLGRAGAALVVNVNASPYHQGKQAERRAVLAERAVEAGCWVAYVNVVGGQDELVFDGDSTVVDSTGEVVACAPRFEERLLVVDLDLPGRGEATPAGGAGPTQATVPVTARSRASGSPLVPRCPAPLDPVAEVYAALVLGTRDYVTKNGFSDVVLGLSGGVDSSLVAVIAADALGADRVHGVLMPSRYSSEHSVGDAEALAEAIGLDRCTVPIEPAHRAFAEMLDGPLGGLEGLTEENLQSRVRGIVLMALSNARGWMVVTTSNKSESAVGYSTLYGDSAGGYAVIKDVPKLLVYELCRHRNRVARDAGAVPPVPESVLTKAPSAELRPDQTDDQSLPPYEELDPLLEALVERDRTPADLVAEGHDEALVRRIARLVDLAEYKRRQFPPGPRVTTKAFGKDRRLPITNAYRG